jgi:ribose-phosphate pyrophosphokinase
MTYEIHAFAEDEAPARRLADALGTPFRRIDLHTFPDGESLPTVAECGDRVAIYRSLDRPDPKLMPLLLAADALRGRGVRRLVLVAPYLCYLRQDAVFQPGQPLSRDVLGRMFADTFDVIVTVEPHLHRTFGLEQVFPHSRVVALSAAEPLAAALSPLLPGALVVGPDMEAKPWVAALAHLVAGEVFTFAKVRYGDREVNLGAGPGSVVAGRHVVIVDDICSTGATLEAAAQTLRSLGAATIDVVVAHALFDAASAARLRQAGIRKLLSTDSCPHPTNAAPLAGLLAQALRDLP